ncbi:hypothetical protein GPJ56_003128 [Histomonas meleagridis]|uniref:uncharacterized protein n=1 Tax=Histomonas meleagridis TaxID=135588 RepID=UPI0035594934|nr:hypothetical protein GPJ56_003128 [Histomonas meleagridis]KAH0800624.1 hypothetical protein GO595_006377 [Histomonas meleagridis]
MSLIDQFYNKSQGILQLAMRINPPQRIPEVIEKLSQFVLGFHLSTNETNFFYQKKKVEPVTIPNFNELSDAAKYMYENHSPNFTKSLVTVGVNSDTVVLNSAHLCADGVYLINVTDAISHIDREIPPFPHLPSNITNNFWEQIHSKSTEQCEYLFTDPEICRVQTKQNITQCNPLYAQHVKIRIPIQELKIYNKYTKQVKGLTEILWTSYILAVSAINDRIDKTGIATCIDMRKFLSQNLRGWNVCNHYSNITPSFKGFNEKMTLKEVGEKMRNDFNLKIQKGHHFSFLNSLTPPENKVIPGIGLELSNIGRFKIAGIVDDVFMKSSVKDANCDPLISHSSFSVDGNGKNVLNGMFRFKSSKIEEKTVNIVAKSVEFVLRNVPLETSVRKAMDMIQEYQKMLK